MGGGCGFIANALHQVYPKALIYSYELSEAAVTFAKEHFKDIEFIVKAIDIDDHFSEGPFDVIVCHEFYPFTRNNDVEYQIAYINTFLNNLTKEGTLMINCLESSQSLISILKQVEQNVGKRGYLVKKQILPAVKIYRAVHNFWLSVALTRILSLALRKKVVYSVIIQKDKK